MDDERQHGFTSPTNPTNKSKTVYVSIPVKTFKTDYFVIKPVNPLSILLNGSGCVG